MFSYTTMLQGLDKRGRISPFNCVAKTLLTPVKVGLGIVHRHFVLCGCGQVQGLGEFGGIGNSQ